MNFRQEAGNRALARDQRIQGKLDALSLPPPKDLLKQIRAYLLHQRDEEGHPGNRVESELRESKNSQRHVLIALGPTIDHGPEPGHFHLSSGARMSFGVTLAERRLISYRFDYRCEQCLQLPFIRFELRDSPHGQPVTEPRAHFHPGVEDLRLPTELVDPFDVLDLLFLVIEPALQRLR